MSRRSLGLALAGFLTLAFVACSGDDDGDFPKVPEVGSSDVTVTFVNSEFVVGENRFVVGLLDANVTPIVDAEVKLRFYDLNSAQPVLKSEAVAASVVPGRDANLQQQIEHIHSDGTRHIHLAAGDDVGVYVANVTFDQPGVWGVEVEYKAADRDLEGVLRPQFNVLATGSTPAVGAPAPRSINRTAADVEEITQIDSSQNPSEELHTATIADTIAAGRPALVLFAVPGYCESRFCGPEIEIMRKLHPGYADRVEFIHVEFYENPGSSDRVPVEPVREWGLRTEPWFFVIDSNGIITARFEGPAGIDELRAALDAMLSQ